MRSIFRLLLVLTAALHGTLMAAPMSDSEIRQMLKGRLAELAPGAGIVVGVIDRDGQRIIAEGVSDRKSKHPVDGDTVYEIGSVTKSFVALLLADMASKGEVRPEDPVQAYLPSTVQVPAEKNKQITLIDLATHRSGLPRGDDSERMNDRKERIARYSETDLYRFLSAHQLGKPIGTQLYSNIGYDLLGHALALRAHQDLEALLQERISAPLVMRSTRLVPTPDMRRRLATGYRRDGSEGPADDLALPGSGRLKSTVNDLLRFLAACMQLTPTPIDAAIAGMNGSTDAAERPGWEHFKPRGADIWIKDGLTYGYASVVAYDTLGGRGVVVLSNTALVVNDIGIKALFRDFSLWHFTVPWPFMQAMATSNYREMLAGYHAFRHRDPTFQLAEEPLNNWGYELLLKQGKPLQAAEIFKLAVYLRPQSANAHDSLAEAYEKAGDYAHAVLSYRTSLALDPGNNNARARLQILEAQ